MYNTRGLNVKEIQFVKIPMWVPLYDIPCNWMVEKKIESITGLMGDILKVLMSENNVAYSRDKVVLKLENSLLFGW